jgi:SAM-dependent methyltransferase
MLGESPHTSLASHDDWALRGAAVPSRIDVSATCHFRQQARKIDEAISGRRYETILELGVYPGQILAYLAMAHGLRATGLEYVSKQAVAVRSAFPEVEVLEGDLLTDGWRRNARQWDIVCSFGLVEHWEDPRVPIARQLPLVAPSGTCIIAIPNHSGPYGALMKALDPEMHARHSGISCIQLASAFRDVAGDEWEISFCDTVEGAGFWNCGVADWVAKRGRAPRWILSKALSVWHRIVTPIPAPSVLRPNVMLIATHKSLNTRA